MIVGLVALIGVAAALFIGPDIGYTLDQSIQLSVVWTLVVLCVKPN